MALEVLVEAVSVVKNHFPNDPSFYRYLAKESASRGKGLHHETIERKLKGNPQDLPVEIEDIVFEAFDIVNDGRGLDDSNFMAVQRNEGPRIMARIYDMGSEMMDWYGFKSKDALAEFLSEQTSVSVYTVRELLRGKTYASVTQGMIGLHSFMHQKVTSAKTSFMSGEYPRRICDDKYLLKDLEPLPFLVDRVIKKFFETGARGALHYINYGLKKFKKTSQLTDLVERVKDNYKLPYIYRFYSYAYELMDNVKLDILPEPSSGTKDPSPLHRKLYAVALAFDYAVRKGKKDELKSKSDPHLFPIAKAEYAKRIQVLRKAGIDGFVLKFLISRIFGVTIENARGYTTEAYDHMDVSYFRQLGMLVDGLPKIFVFNMGPKGANDRELNRLNAKYKGGLLIVNYSGLQEKIDYKSLVEIRRFASGSRGNKFFYSRNIDVKKAPGFKDARQISKDMIYGAIGGK